MSETIQIQADWAQTDSTQIDFIKNKPNLYEEWWGTQSEYDAILVKDPDKIYNIKTVYYAVSISAGSNGSVTVNGVTGNYTATVPSGTTLTIEGTADTNYQFDEWSDGVSTNPRTITVNGNLTLTAAFEIITYSVSISAGSNGSVTVNGVSGDFSDDVASGTVLTVQGTANNGYLFDEWSDGNTDNPRTITVSGDITLSAAFEAIPNYFYVEDISGSDNTLSIVKVNNNAPDVTVYKSTNGLDWTSMGTTSTTAITATIPANGKLYLKATANCWGASYTGNKINCSANYNTGGNIMSLLNGDNFENTSLVDGYSFTRLFYGSTTLINAVNITLPNNTAYGCYYDLFNGCSGLTTVPVLPATSLVNECYHGMFSGCTSLTTPPALPATSTSNYCYYEMFRGCTSLTTAPTLPATYLNNDCYGGMFRGCTSLTTAPALPVTTLSSRCYTSMFQGCTTLTTAPALPATKLTTNCYKNMFNGCTLIDNITTYAQDISATDCLTDWLKNVSATGDFYNEGGATYTVDSPSGIPQGWTEHKPLNYFYVEDISGSNNTLSITKSSNSAPTIEVFKSTDMSTWESMGSTSTTPITATVPANGKLYLKAVCDRWSTDNGFSAYNNIINCNGNFNVGGYLSSLVLGDNYNTNTIQNKQVSTFSNLFKNNINLINTNKLILPDDVLKHCYKCMFQDCTNLTTAPALPATTLYDYCYQSMFRNCTSLTTAPALPAITLREGCYNSMFSGCTSLTTAPELPTTNLNTSAYSWMFSGCINLNKVITYNTNYYSDYFNNWLNNVAATGDFYNLGGATYQSGASGIPSGWTEHNSL